MKRYFGLLLILLLIPVLQITTVRAENGFSHTIVSEYQSLVPGRSANRVNWRFIQQNLGANGFLLAVEDLDQKVGCRAELYFNSSMALEQTDCFRWVNGEEVCSASQYDAAKPVILSSTIIPGDWLNWTLPFVYQAAKYEAVIYEQIGTARFATYLTIQDYPVSRSKAVAEGMIRSDLQPDLDASAKLCLVEITRNSGNHNSPELLLRQLWVTGDNFWVYEEKAGRRSWRVLKK